MERYRSVVSEGLRRLADPVLHRLIYDKRAFPDKAPTSLADLWNTEEFPGKRCVSAYASYALEAAAYASSGSRDGIYPLDVDAAIAKYDEIKPEIAKFWTTGQEPIQLVSDGECVMSTAWNGRAFTAQVLEGIDYLGTVWDGGVLHDGYWSFLRELLTLMRRTPHSLTTSCQR